MNDQRAYWDRAAAAKTFTHPLDTARLRTYADPSATILDYGCGYGRLSTQLREAGYRNVIGMDFSEAMIGRARAAHPGLAFEVVRGPRLPLDDASVDAVLLFAVLTCIASEHEQQTLAADIARVLRPGGIVHVSDYLLQTDARNAARYAACADRFGTHGVFLTDDGAVVRHHTRAWLDGLFAGFTRETEASIELTTMNGHRSTGFQFIDRKPGGGGT